MLATLKKNYKGQKFGENPFTTFWVALPTEYSYYTSVVDDIITEIYMQNRLKQWCGLTS